MIGYLKRLLHHEPPGYSLLYADTKRIGSGIRGDLVPVGTTVIVYNGVHFVRTGELDYNDFEVYQEGHSTFEYKSWG